LGARVLQLLRFVEDGGVEVDVGKMGPIPHEQPVRHEQDVTRAEGGELVGACFGRRPSVQHHAERRREPLDFVAPVVGDRGGRHDQRRAGRPRLGRARSLHHRGQRLDGLSEAHIVGQDTARAPGG
jgi:hypothetical protein